MNIFPRTQTRLPAEVTVTAGTTLLVTESPAEGDLPVMETNSSTPNVLALANSFNTTLGEQDRFLEDLNSSLATPLLDWVSDSCFSWNLTATQFRALNCADSDPPMDPIFVGTVCLSFAILFLAGLIGNSLVCYVVYAAPRMRTVTNLLIANMAVGDLLMTALCMPFTVAFTVLLQRWPLGDTFCRLLSFAQPVSVYVSAYTLIAIAVDRYRAIVYPLLPRGSRRAVRAAIAAVWTLAALTSLPAAVTSRAYVPADPWHTMHEYKQCEERWEDGSRQYYTVAVLLLQFFLPVTVLTITYGRIAVEVWGRGSLLAARPDNRQIRLARAKRKTVQMMVIVVVAFTVCWLPYHVLQILFDTHPSVRHWPGIKYLYTATFWLSMASCVCNPVIYCAMNAQFRAGFSAVAARVCLRCRRRPAISRASSSIRSRATSYTQWTLRSLRLRRSQSSPPHHSGDPEPTDKEAAPLNTRVAVLGSTPADPSPPSRDATNGVSSPLPSLRV